MTEVERILLTRELHFALKERRHLTQRINELGGNVPESLSVMYESWQNGLVAVNSKIDNINNIFAEAGLEPHPFPFTTPL